MNLDGSAPRQVTSNAARDELPALSPDGSLIAFVSQRDEPATSTSGRRRSTARPKACCSTVPAATSIRCSRPTESTCSLRARSAATSTSDTYRRRRPLPGRDRDHRPERRARDEPVADPRRIRLAYGRSAAAWTTSSAPTTTAPTSSRSPPTRRRGKRTRLLARRDQARLRQDGALVIAESAARAHSRSRRDRREPREPGVGGRHRARLRAAADQVTRSPKRRSEKTRAKFRFTASEPGSSFECRLDRRGFKPCASPRRYRGLKRAATASASARSTPPATSTLAGEGRLPGSSRRPRVSQDRAVRLVSSNGSTCVTSSEPSTA